MRCPGLQGCILLARIAVGALSATSANAQELVINGGFETGNFSGWFVPPNVAPPNINPAHFHVGGGGGHTGDHYAGIASTQLQFISQILPTQAGTDYELSFWLRRPTNAPQFFTVRWEGEVVYHEWLNGPSFQWAHFSLPLTADITGSFLEFGQQVFPGEWHIDDISVVQVPAPSAAAVMVVGGAVAMRRRRRGFTAGAREVAG